MATVFALVAASLFALAASPQQRRSRPAGDLAREAAVAPAGGTGGVAYRNAGPPDRVRSMRQPSAVSNGNHLVARCDDRAHRVTTPDDEVGFAEAVGRMVVGAAWP